MRHIGCWSTLAAGVLCCLGNSAPAEPGKASLLSNRWQVGPPILLPGPRGSFDETAVKDPSVVFFAGRWHVFYTARGKGQYATGYVSAPRLEELGRARRHELRTVRGTTDRYGCAPQVFYFAPQNKWYLIFQTRDAHYQPAFCTTTTIDQPQSWSNPLPLAAKADRAKWIDFWVICDESTAYLFFTRDHRDVCVLTTDIGKFPDGWKDRRRVFGPVHEAVHVYQAQGLGQYHMLYETLVPGTQKLRRFGLATAEHLMGPWKRVSDDFATRQQLVFPPGSLRWTDEVSHGELIRVGYDQQLVYDPQDTTFLIQGLLTDEHRGLYPGLRWKLGLLQKESGHPGNSTNTSRRPAKAIKGVSPMSKPLRIVALGDSITNGVGRAGVKETDTFRNLVQGELARRLGRKVEVINAGVNGDIVTLALERLDRDVLARQPEVVTVMFGGNEAGFYRPETNGFAQTPRVTREDFKAALAKIVDRLQASGTTVVLMTCPPMTERYWGMYLEPYQKNGINFLVRDYAHTMREVAKEKGVELIDVYSAFQQDPETLEFFPDGLHPDARGHRVIADLLVERLPRAVGLSGQRPLD